MPTLAAIAILLLAWPAAAQRDRDGRGNPNNPNAIDATAIQRANDELVLQRAMEKTARERPLRSAKLKSAIADFEANDYKAAPLSVVYSEFLTAGGGYWVAFHFESGADERIPADGKATLFGVVKRGDAPTQLTREEPVTLVRTPSGSWFYECSLPFHEGNYDAT